MVGDSGLKSQHTWDTLCMKAEGTMSSPYLKSDQIKAGTLLRSREDGSLVMILEAPAYGYGFTGFVSAYDFKKQERIQLNTGYIHAEVVGGGV